MGAGEGRDKKLKRDRLELLRWRVAARLRYKSVAAWEADTEPTERAYMLAIAMLDAWGEEWQEIAARVHNAALNVCASNGADVDKLPFKNADDMRRRWASIDEPERQGDGIDWQAAQAAFRQSFTGGVQ